MHSIIKNAFSTEMSLGTQFYKELKYTESFYHFERAHILGQRYIVPHTYNHWWMLKLGIRKKDKREIIGQIIRLLVAGIGSFLGRVPIGNTGGANIGIMKVLPIPDEINEIFRKAEGK